MKADTPHRRMRKAVFVVVIAATILMLFAVFAASPLANPYEGAGPIFVVAVPVLIAVLMAIAIWWIMREANRPRNEPPSVEADRRQEANDD